jgi:hypothetical protein
MLRTFIALAMFLAGVLGSALIVGPTHLGRPARQLWALGIASAVTLAAWGYDSGALKLPLAQHLLVVPSIEAGWTALRLAVLIWGVWLCVQLVAVVLLPWVLRTRARRMVVAVSLLVAIAASVLGRVWLKDSGIGARLWTATQYASRPINLINETWRVLAHPRNYGSWRLPAHTWTAFQRPGTGEALLIKIELRGRSSITGAYEQARLRFIRIGADVAVRASQTEWTPPQTGGDLAVFNWADDPSTVVTSLVCTAAPNPFEQRTSQTAIGYGWQIVPSSRPWPDTWRAAILNTPADHP